MSLTLGWLILLLGLITWPLPLPIGMVLTLVGLSILVSVSITARQVIRRLRQRFPRVSHWLTSIKHNTPRFVQRMIELTTPSSDADQGSHRQRSRKKGQP